MFGKDPYEGEYQFLIIKCKGADLKHCNDSETFIEYLMNDISENIGEKKSEQEKQNTDCVWWIDCW